MLCFLFYTTHKCVKTYTYLHEYRFYPQWSLHFTLAAVHCTGRSFYVLNQRKLITRIWVEDASWDVLLETYSNDNQNSPRPWHLYSTMTAVCPQGFSKLRSPAKTEARGIWRQLHIYKAMNWKNPLRKVANFHLYSFCCKDFPNVVFENRLVTLSSTSRVP